MGAITNEQEDAEALALVHAMPKEARRWIQHHFGNALAGAIGMLTIGRYAECMEALDHAVSDLRKVTPPAERAQIAEINLQMIRQRRQNGGR